MRSKLLFLSVLFLAGMSVTSCNRKIEINNGHLHLVMNDRMQIHIGNSFKGAKPLMQGFASSEYLVTQYFTAKDFSLTGSEQKTIHNHAGEGTEWVLKGKYKAYPLQKIVSITTYKNFPDAAYFKVQYVNKGRKDLPVLKWVNNHYDLIPSDKDTTKFWSFQGSSHEDRRDWIQKVNPGFYHKNYMGMNASDYGGGIPVVDLWRRDAGIAIGQSDTIFRLVSLPVNYDRYAGEVSIGVSYRYRNDRVLAPNDTLSTFETFVSVHDGDCFSTLRNYSLYMQAKGIKPARSEAGAFEPVWCAWGYERDFTVAEILHTLPKVKELGIKWVGIDDGYYQSEGDWHTNKTQFPYGDAEMKELVDSIHAQGLKAVLWWNPVAVSPRSDFLKEHPNVILRQKNGAPEYITWWKSFYISPTDSTAIAATKNTVKLFLGDWGFDGLKLDGQNMNMCAPDYADGHDISDPNQSFQRLPDFFRDIFVTARSIDTNAVVEFCPCGEVMNFYIMPYTNQFVASDPTSSWQVRSKGMAYHALMPHTAYFGDHVELINDDFASQIGVGGVPGTKFVWPSIGTSSEKDLLLTPAKDSLFRKWIGLYNRMMLSKGKYLGDLYDIGYDYPETHCIEKDGVMYYAFYNPHFNGKVELRGLDSAENYSVRDYFHQKSYGIVKGSHPDLAVEFRNFLMLEVTPNR